MDAVTDLICPNCHSHFVEVILRQIQQHKTATYKCRECGKEVIVPKGKAA